MSGLRLIRRPAAKQDLTNHFVYLGKDAGVDTAERFIDAAEEAFNRLGKMPDLGTRCQSLSPRWKDLRR